MAISTVASTLFRVCAAALCLAVAASSSDCDACSGFGVLHGDHCDCFAGFTRGSSMLTCEPAKECLGHGSLKEGHCECESGYEHGCSTLVCVKPSYTKVLQHTGHTPEERVWALLGRTTKKRLGVPQVQTMFDALSGQYTLPSLNDHPEYTNDQEHADGEHAGRRLLQEMCGGHGHLDYGVCHCDAGYVLDPADDKMCLPAGGGGAVNSDTPFKLTAKAVVAAAGQQGYLAVEQLADALPIITACQMDSICSLETTPMPEDFEGGSGKSESEVELWMALVATAVFFVVPLVFMFIPRLVFRYVSGRQMDIIVSLGNCLSAGMIFSLGLMHIVPETVEASYKITVPYPLNYFFLALGFFITLFAEEIVADGYHLGEEGLPHCHGPQSVQQPAAIFSNQSSASIPPTPIKALRHDAIPVAESTDDKRPVQRNMSVQSNMSTKSRQGLSVADSLKSMLPLIVFFLALQFHATLEAIIIGVQQSLENFWTLFAGVAIHKAFVSLAFGLKLHINAEGNDGHYDWYLITLAILWALVPALCVLVGYLVSDGIDPMAKLIVGSLCGGTFLYVGGFEILSHEFKQHSLPPGSWGTATRDKWYKFAFVMLGLLMVCLLSLVPHKHD